MSLADNTEPGAERIRSLTRWLDRWLEPRWRALLTWVALAAVSRWTWDSGLLSPINSIVPLGLKHLGVDFPPAVLAGRHWAETSAAMFCLCWFQPLCLRLGAWRWIGWVSANAILMNLIIITEIWHGLIQDLRSEVIALGNLFGIAGLVTVGARSRPWMSIVGGTLAMSFVGYFRFSGLTWVGLVAGSNFIYGAVLLYGTDPLPRCPLERQTR